MAIKKVVDGQVVLMSPEEEEGFIANRDIVDVGARNIAKSVVIQRLIVAGKIDAAYAALVADPTLFAQFFAPDVQTIGSNSAAAHAFLNSIGADPAVILA